MIIRAAQLDAMQPLAESAFEFRVKQHVLAYCVVPDVPRAVLQERVRFAIRRARAYQFAGEQAITTHDPHSRASHWHAVIRFVKENPCLACQWHRLFGSITSAGLASPTVPVSPADRPAPATARTASLGQPSSRAPPTLL